MQVMGLIMGFAFGLATGIYIANDYHRWSGRQGRQCPTTGGRNDHNAIQYSGFPIKDTERYGGTGRKIRKVLHTMGPYQNIQTDSGLGTDTMQMDAHYISTISIPDYEVGLISLVSDTTTRAWVVDRMRWMPESAMLRMQHDVSLRGLGCA